MKVSSSVLTYLASLLLLVCTCWACNEAICASLVSKCQLIESCGCDMSNMTNCSCCSNCQLCLAQLYSECCSCVGMCPSPDPEDSIFKTSAIEILPDPIPDLFNVLTEEEDHLKRWTTNRYPVYFESMYSRTANKDNSKDPLHAGGLHPLEGLENCTVAFMSKCTSLSKCKQSCKSMGAAKYRWFHNEGCCQCIGDRCIDYGLNEPKCLECHGDDEEEDLAAQNTEIEMEVAKEEVKVDTQEG